MNPDDRGRQNTKARVIRYLTVALHKQVPFPWVDLVESPLGSACSLLFVSGQRAHVKIYDGSVFLYRGGDKWDHIPFPKHSRGHEAARRLLNEIVNVAELTRQRTEAQEHIRAAQLQVREEQLAAEAKNVARVRHNQQAFDKVVRHARVFDNGVRFLADEHGGTMVLNVRITPVQAEKLLAALVESKILYQTSHIPADVEE